MTILTSVGVLFWILLEIGRIFFGILASLVGYEKSRGLTSQRKNVGKIKPEKEEKKTV